MRVVLAPGVAVEESELLFRATRAGGPGGQNVNKVATRVELRWSVRASSSLTAPTKARLLKALASRLDTSGSLRLVSARERTQARNRALVLERLRQLVAAAMRPAKVRRPSKPSRQARERRLRLKRHRGEVKAKRRSPPSE